MQEVAEAQLSMLASAVVVPDDATQLQCNGTCRKALGIATWTSSSACLHLHQQ